MVLESLVVAIWLMLPAYVANCSAALFGGGRSIDGGLVLWDGRRALGDGKTLRGLALGSACGVGVGILQMLMLSTAQETLQHLDVRLPAFGEGLEAGIIVFCLSVGALLGDMAASFFKRRLGLKRGSPLPPIDQLDFVAGAWLLTALVAREWFFEQFTTGVMLAVIIITPVLHVASNVIGYLMGKKQVPW
ncbi:MAG TPA: CDP-2,3-bis-(O-geranylgeranyl)-sn-glycerol synthase [Methermicoccus shengliensis]|uniref:CDP-archaeol synthase n=2 Tax=Methermicoccus shengliensis TaxID=660064 RepID=A0A832RW98_9EURY|nr:CDP-2,3-bis-(O-geranylgeranyl)-sn-glycerol synthase [Methermicoccus shengliensis]KUK04915.1 MAG: hypothetical protein XD46_0446 [Euryarchaeota archaeon 55_53]KUK30443.1 MAG: hypothetical protein XD62_0514 [Methanosarcinales archeaon 56_1174]MDI3488642.1 CDP-2,3-bis-(O-geranylgeranyl)-sn-glycerol synthase [Methanosarcinales archaeon]MDN5295303.1 CDP-2,3-bis-(O-geranylgeranyl)-sn-glycerol synthase [Methanosarcinales archaeon]HIH69609.1 CDP-2,3-bis-(O-geranylgeranyl)-sn-glycerol synthase [Meth